MCCAIVAMLLAMFPAWNGGREAALAWLANSRNVAVGGASLMTFASGAALAASAFPHQATHICSLLTGF